MGIAHHTWLRPAHAGERCPLYIHYIETADITQVNTHPLVICIQNDNYPASLERRKIYETIPDLDAEKHHQLRVIDESGEDYLYPESYFIPVTLPKKIEAAIIKTA